MKKISILAVALLLPFVLAMGALLLTREIVPDVEYPIHLALIYAAFFLLGCFWGGALVSRRMPEHRAAILSYSFPLEHLLGLASFLYPSVLFLRGKDYAFYWFDFLVYALFLGFGVASAIVFAEGARSRRPPTAAPGGGGDVSGR